MSCSLWDPGQTCSRHSPHALLMLVDALIFFFNFYYSIVSLQCVSFSFKKIFLLTCFTTCYFLVYRTVTQLYIRIYSFSYSFSL